MPLYTTPSAPTVYFDQTDEWLDPSFRDYMSAVAQDAKHDLPVNVALDQIQMYGLAAQAAGISTEEDETGFPVVSYAKQTPDILDKEAQTARIREAGLDGVVKPQDGYSAAMLDVVLDRRRAALERATLRQAAPAAWAPAGLAVGLATSMLDPINIAAAFFPVVPEWRALSYLRKAKSALGRAGVRAGLGAVEGAAGSVVPEALTAATRYQEQADYDMTDALANVGFGAVFGAALQPAAGAVGDWLRAKAGQRHPWEFAAPTSDTIALKDAHAQEIHDARLEADSSLDNARLSQEAHAAAAIFDARARAWAYDMQRPVQEYYAAWLPEYRAGGAPLADDALTHAMYRSKASNVHEFLDEALVDQSNGKKPFFHLQNDFGETTIELGGDQVRHIRNRHADFQQWERIPEALEKGKSLSIGKNRVTGTDTRVYVMEDGGDALVVVAAPDVGGKGRKSKKTRTIVLTAFTDSTASVRNWIEGRNAASSRSDGELHLDPDAHGVNPSGPQSGADESIIRIDSEIKGILGGDALNQPAYQGSPESPRAAVTFDADGKAVIEFFAASDFSSAPHELYHVFRREMAQTAAHPDAPARVREGWAKMEEFVGAEPGQTWTREMEEKFARAGERFLLEGKAPSPELQTVFERLRQWFLELYANADAAGLEITNEMRTVFGNMLTTPMEDGDKAFRYALGSMMTRSFVEDMDTRLPAQPDLDGKPLEAVRALGDDALADLDATWRQVQDAHPELRDAVGEAYREDVRVAEAEEAAAVRRKEVLDEIVRCEMRR